MGRTILMCMVLFNLLSVVPTEGNSAAEGGGEEDNGVRYIPILERICAEDLKRLCPSLLGKSENISNCEVTDCISKHLWKEREARSKAESQVSSECNDAVALFQRQRGYDLTLDKRLWDVCGDEANMMVLPQFAIFDLLKTPVGVESLHLSEACQEEVFLRKRDSVYDYRIDNKMAANCEEDAKKLCKRVPPKEGHVQECLRKHVENKTISYKCNAELYRQERESADDWRLNLPLWRACLDDRQKFCPNVEDGKSRVLDCLEDHRYNLSKPCFEVFDKKMLRRSVDYRFDYHVAIGCGEDLDKVCKPSGTDLKDELPTDAGVLQCLQDNIEKLMQESCYKAVTRVIKRASEDLRFDHRTYDWCQDKQTHCLYTKVMEKPLDEAVTPDCEANVLHDMDAVGDHYCYNFPLRRECAGDISRLCSTASKSLRRSFLMRRCHGSVLQCLWKKAGEIKSKECHKELMFHQQMLEFLDARDRATTKLERAMPAIDSREEA
ncbi:hypothetical protein CBR_g51447 [Chara braunii]|uniref:Golgi apparatus protein 1 n=1 Tax=Chara braunii TaxID=69332 RepID=A0A388K6J0_CHABU|nr:hypothetical protein CBR_g51447 [Chara braunii]|eukprot:GBG65563.1 hypothetical protein CBR_g51447 [Chara braunii]